ncbi:MAG: tripartite tricarboxylate transporter substrate-binding protein, partial [Sulfuricaulis sp.]|nr:tripartite tricarboxylate transporter substrate-binding protein [Sulfuricaulis sp.]
MKSQRFLAATLLAAVLVPGVEALAQATGNAYPNRPIRLVVAQSPGSSIDAMGRVVATKMSELLGEQLVVDNRTGAGG